MKWCKIGSKLLLTTNRNMYTCFRLVPKSMTLNDIGVRFRVIYFINYVKCHNNGEIQLSNDSNAV